MGSLRLNLPTLCALGTAAWIIVWFGDTTKAMAVLWSSSASYSHGWVVVPLTLWLTWRKRAELASIPARPTVIPLFLLPFAGFAWLLGDIVSAPSASQFALVTMVILATWAIVGHELTVLLAFPLGFLLFAVPTGEFLLPTLMEHTADLVVGVLRITGVPAHLDGAAFSTPTGDWPLANAFNSMRYFIAVAMAGCLYAYQRYCSALRRLWFVTVLLLLSVLGVAAYSAGVISVSHWSGQAQVSDHLHLAVGAIASFACGALIVRLSPGNGATEHAVQRRAHPFSATRGNFNLNVRIVAIAVMAILVASFWKPVQASIDAPTNAMTTSGDLIRALTSAVRNRLPLLTQSVGP